MRIVNETFFFLLFFERKRLRNGTKRTAERMNNNIDIRNSIEVAYRLYWYRYSGKTFLNMKKFECWNQKWKMKTIFPSNNPFRFLVFIFNHFYGASIWTIIFFLFVVRQACFQHLDGVIRHGVMKRLYFSWQCRSQNQWKYSC